MKSLRCFILFVLFLFPIFVFGMQSPDKDSGLSFFKLDIDGFLENALSRNIRFATELKAQLDRHVKDDIRYTNLLKYIHDKLSADEKLKIHNVYEKKLWNVGFYPREEEMSSLVKELRKYVSDFESTLASNVVPLNGNSYESTSESTSSSDSDEPKETPSSSSSESPRLSADVKMPENFYQLDEQVKIRTIKSLGEGNIPEIFGSFIARALIGEGRETDDLQSQAKKYLTETFADYIYQAKEGLKNKIEKGSESPLQETITMAEIRGAFYEFEMNMPNLFRKDFESFLKSPQLSNDTIKTTAGLVKDQIERLKLDEEKYKKVVGKLYEGLSKELKDKIYKQAKFVNSNIGVTLPDEDLKKIVVSVRVIVSNFDKAPTMGTKKSDKKVVEIEKLKGKLIELRKERDNLLKVKMDKTVNKKVKVLDGKIEKSRKKIEKLQVN